MEPSVVRRGAAGLSGLATVLSLLGAASFPLAASGPVDASTASASSTSLDGPQGALRVPVAARPLWARSMAGSAEGPTEAAALLPAATPERDAATHAQAPALDLASMDPATSEPAFATTTLGTSFTDMPSREIVLNALLPPVPSQDVFGSGFGKTDGQVAIVMYEDTRLKSRRSLDGGATFGGEVEISGAGQPDVAPSVDARLSGDGKLYLAWVAVDPSGDLGLRFARSDDMGQTWTAPRTLVGAGDASMGVTHLRLATGPAGRAAIVYRGSEGSDPWVVATADSGATWTAPRRIDTGVAARSAPNRSERIAMDSAGRIYAAFIQTRGGVTSLYYTRSTDGGVTFAAEQSPALPAHTSSARPDLAVAADGGVLLTLWDSAGADHLYVLRSVNQGLTYATVLDRTLANDNAEIIPGFAVDPATSITFAGWVRSSNELVAVRSGDSGATWGADQVLTTTAAAGSASPGILAARTSAGTWVVAWTDQRADTYAHTLTDVYARSSTDGGLTWGIEQKADGGVAGAHASVLQGLAANGTNNVFLLYQDGRDDNGRSFDLFGNRSAASPLSFGADTRADADGTPVPPAALDQVALASDGASHVYAAFPAFTTGPRSDVLVASSADGGRSFGTPVRVGSTAAGSRISMLPEILAFADGKVYLVYVSDNPGVGREIRFNRSTNFGVSWQPSDTVLAQLAHPAGYFAGRDWPATDLEALADGSVYVAWSNGADVFLARSTDGGAIFATADVDQDGRGQNRFPRICARGSLLVLSWLSPNLANTNQSVWGVFSTTKGVSWSTTRQLRAEGVPNGVDLHTLACDASGHAVAVWPDARDSVRFEVCSSRFDGANWSGETSIAGPAGVNEFLPQALYVDATTALVIYGDQSSQVYVSRSTDGGGFFSSFQRLDDAAPDPSAASFLGRLTADGTGNVWASWLDTSAGLPSLVVRRSSNSGLTYGSVYRVDRKTPQGGYGSSAFFPDSGSRTASLPGAALFGWAATRESFTFDALVNAYDTGDFDRDGALAAADCNDADPDLKAAPVEVAGDAVSKVPGAVRLAWSSQDATAGAATSYDVVTGLLGNLRATGGFGGASCLANDVANTPYDDARAGPSAGGGFYYVLRAQNVCGTATYGPATAGPRVITVCP